MTDKEFNNEVTIFNAAIKDKNFAHKLFTKAGIDISNLNLSNQVSNAKVIDVHKDLLAKVIYNEGDGGEDLFRGFTRDEVIKVIGDYGIINLKTHYDKLRKDIEVSCLVIKENNLDAQEVFKLVGITNFNHLPKECDGLMD